MATKIFPYYKEQYLGRTKLGYNNVKNAKARMFVPRKMVLEHFGLTEEEYDAQNRYCCQVDFDNKISYKTLDRENKIYGEYPDKRVLLSSIDKEILEELKEIEKMMWRVPLYYADNIKEIEKTSKIIKEFQERTGLFPLIHFDNKPFEKMEKKFIKEAVNYIEKEVTIIIG